MISFICLLFVLFAQLVALIGYIVFYISVSVVALLSGIPKSRKDNSEAEVSNNEYRILEKRPGEKFEEIFSCTEKEVCKKKLAELRRENGLNVYIVKRPID